GAGQIRNPKSEIRILGIPLVLFLVFCTFQLIPLPPFLLKVISPQTLETYRQILPGWPEPVPYAELASMEQRAKSEEQSEMAVSGVRSSVLGSREEQRTNSKEQGAGSTE